MRGYYNKPELTAEVLTPMAGIKTGDVGQFNEDGHLTLTDRKKDCLSFLTANTLLLNNLKAL
jgi:long-chain acyl-CoA synthetase